MKKTFAAAVIATALTTPAVADSIEQLESQQAIDESLGAMNRFVLQVEAIGKRRTTECMRAFGHKEFCQCISKNIPWVFNFQQYVAITTKPKKDLGYDQLNDEMKDAFDKVRPVRDQCVKELISK